MSILKKTSLFAMLMGFLWLAGYAAFSISTISIKPKNTGASSDAIIVLTGGNYRIKTGFDLWAQHYAPHLFITGVHKSVTLSALVREWEKVNTDNLPLPNCCAAVGHSATTTIENAQEAAAWIKRADGAAIKTIHLVTSTYHTPRAQMEFQRAMPEIKIINHPVTQGDYKVNEKRFWRITASEYNKIIFRRISFVVTDIQTTLIEPLLEPLNRNR